MNKYEQLKQKIIEACPHKNFINEDSGHKNIFRLADVLLACSKNLKLFAICKDEENGTICDKRFIDILRLWNWQDNNLDNQSPETKQFIQDILL